jgi:ComF family protein
MTTLLERASRLTLDLLFPPQCAICRRDGMLLCELCIATLPLAEAPRCDRCWEDVVHGSLCSHCAQEAPSFQAARAPYTHDDGARTLVHLLKYQGLTSLAEPMAQLMTSYVDGVSLDLVVPVPLHGGRQRARGYNQSSLLARHIARGSDLAFDDRAARRVGATRQLVHSMDRNERSRIVDGAFRADPSRVEGRRVLLIDDVMTTGATMRACSMALLESGAASVQALTFVRA